MRRRALRLCDRRCRVVDALDRERMPGLSGIEDVRRYMEQLCEYWDEIALRAAGVSGRGRRGRRWWPASIGRGKSSGGAVETDVELERLDVQGRQGAQDGRATTNEPKPSKPPGCGSRRRDLDVPC